MSTTSARYSPKTSRAEHSKWNGGKPRLELQRFSMIGLCGTPLAASTLPRSILFMIKSKGLFSASGKSDCEMATNRREFWASLQPQFRAEPDPYGLIARAAIMLESFVLNALNDVWPGGKFPKEFKLDHSQRLDILRALHVWPKPICDAASAFNGLRNKMMHNLDFEVNSNTILPFLEASEEFVRELDEGDDTSELPIPDLDSVDGLTWGLSRHLTAMLAFVDEYFADNSGLCIGLVKPIPNALEPFQPLIGIDLLSAGATHQPTFREKLRTISGAQGKVYFAAITSFPTFAINLEQIASLIDANHWSKLVVGARPLDPTHVFVYLVRSENGLAVVAISETGEAHFLKRIDASDARPLLQLLSKESWHELSGHGP